VVLGAQISGALLLGGFMVWWFPSSPFARSMILSANLDTETGYTSDPTNTDLVGKTVDVVTALRPAGTIEYKGKRISAVADGEFIDAGNFVRVLEVHGNRVVVERIDDATVKD
jgi:membrane-bound serine protease (ClpP class)